MDTHADRIVQPPIMLGLALAIIVSISGCSGMPVATATDTMKVGGLELVSKTAEQEVIIFRTPDDKERFCIAPYPDAVPTFGDGVTLSLPGRSIGDTNNIGADVLGGRSPSTLITRELLYRSCELAMNYQLDKGEAQALYRDTLSAIVKITTSQTGNGTAPLEAKTSITTVPTPSPSPETSTNTSNYYSDTTEGGSADSTASPDSELASEF